MIGQSLAISALAVWLYVLTVYAVALVRKDYSLMDKGWSFGILLAVIAPLALSHQVALRQVAVTVLVAVWAVRLGVHVIMRGWGRGEGQRYAAFRESWGRHNWFFAFFHIFLLQGMLMFLAALPASLVNSVPGKAFNWLDILGIVVWLKGFLWEVIADHQLTRFRQDPANEGRILSSGLWSLSRHPNYFGEALQWWGIWLMAVAAMPGAWILVVSPLLVTFLLLKVSGVPLLEAHQRQNPEFREYAKHTPAFIPGIPKLFRRHSSSLKLR